MDTPGLNAVVTEAADIRHIASFPLHIVTLQRCSVEVPAHAVSGGILMRNALELSAFTPCSMLCNILLAYGTCMFSHNSTVQFFN